MLQLPRKLAWLTLATSLTLPSLYGLSALAQDTAPPPATPTPDATTPPPAAPASPAPDATMTPPAAPAPAAPDTGGPPSAPAPTPAGGDQPAAPATPAAPSAGGDVGAPPPAPGTTELGSPVVAPAPADATPAERKLRNDVDAYFHYAWIGRYDLATQFADAAADEANDPALLIRVMESTARRHDPNMGYLAQLSMFDAQPDAKAGTDKLLLKVQSSNVTLSQDPNFIEKTLRDMSMGERAYENHLPTLRKSGEMAVPIMLNFLNNEDEAHRPYQGTVRRALVDMGRVAVNPLLAATFSKDPAVLLATVNALGQLGYDAAVPFLARLAQDSSQAQPVRDASRTALSELGVDAGAASDPAHLFYQLADHFYAGSANYNQVIGKPGSTPTTPMEVSNLWKWEEGRGLTREEVPSHIFNDLMAMRCTEDALMLNPGLGEAVSLWIDADNKKEVDLPDGQTAPADMSVQPAHFYNVSVGVNYLNDALRRAITDSNPGVALKLTKSLGEILGPRALAASPDSPLVSALQFPNKLVRFEAAFAMAAGLPEHSFAGQEQVVPLLMEALASGGKGNVLVLAPDLDSQNKMIALVRQVGYGAAGAVTPGQATSAALELPDVDVILIAPGVGSSAAQQMLGFASTNPRLKGAARLVMEQGPGGFFSTQALSDPMLSVAPVSDDGKAVDSDIAAARTKAQDAPLTDQDATAYALRSAALLERLALNHNTVLNIAGNEGPLLNALGDARPDIVKAVGNVLGLVPAKEAQQGLLAKALDASVSADVRTALFLDLATSAKLSGNQLDAASVGALQKAIDEEKDDTVRLAAAQARGALNLPVDVASQLILGANEQQTSQATP